MSFYKVTIDFITDEVKKNGDPKVIVENWLIEDETTEGAIEKVYAKLKEEGTTTDIEVTGVKKEKIQAVITKKGLEIPKI